MILKGDKKKPGEPAHNTCATKRAEGLHEEKTHNCPQLVRSDIYLSSRERTDVRLLFPQLSCARSCACVGGGFRVLFVGVPPFKKIISWQRALRPCPSSLLASSYLLCFYEVECRTNLLISPHFILLDVCRVLLPALEYTLKNRTCVRRAVRSNSKVCEGERTLHQDVLADCFDQQPNGSRTGTVGLTDCLEAHYKKWSGHLHKTDQFFTLSGGRKISFCSWIGSSPLSSAFLGQKRSLPKRRDLANFNEPWYRRRSFANVNG